MEEPSKDTFVTKELDGKRVLVIGGTKGGMGEAIVNRLTHAGSSTPTGGS